MHARRLKSEVSRVLRAMNGLRIGCGGVHKGVDRTKKRLDQISEAREAEIQNLDKADVACASKDICDMRTDDQPFHTDGGKGWHAMCDNTWSYERMNQAMQARLRCLHGDRDTILQVAKQFPYAEPGRRSWRCPYYAHEKGV